MIRKGGITTQGETLAELHAMVTDAVKGYFESAEQPQDVRLHFAQDPASVGRGAIAGDCRSPYRLGSSGC